MYDSKKAGTVTVSHLRFGPKPIHSTYLLAKTDFVACHQHGFLERFDMLEKIEPGGTFLLNTPHGPNEVWDHLPRTVQQHIINKNLKFYVINAYEVARRNDMGSFINTIMQTCFFAISGVLPREQALTEIKAVTKKAFARKGQAVVDKNIHAIEDTIANLHEVKVPSLVTSKFDILPPVSEDAPKFVREVEGEIIARRGESLPVSAFPLDGTFPTGTTQFEKRNLALEIPVWEPDICIQCGKCAMVCPHAVIRVKAYEPQYLKNAPATFKSTDASDKEWAGLKYTIQVAPEDCTGCSICVDVCPKVDKQTGVKAIHMELQPPLREPEAKNWDFFRSIPELDRSKIKVTSIRQQQAQQPLFEFSGACAGCGETPYIKLATQLFGDRMVVANATGCSSIYGANLPTTPWAKNANGYGPAWANSLFEDNAEFGLGIRLSIDKNAEYARVLLQQLSAEVGGELVEAILNADQSTEPGIYEQRSRVAILKERVESLRSPEAKRLLAAADYLVKKSVWIMGGDGWAYDIGYGGLDHVISGGRKVNILVLDTEVYSNTGGQASKSTPRAAVARFAAGGKPMGKKDLGMMAMTYGSVYVASVAMGANDERTLRAFIDAEAYPGTSLIIAYSHCIEHGIDMEFGMTNQKLMVETGAWIPYRFNPLLVKEGKNPLTLDARRPKKPISEFLDSQNRFRRLKTSDPQTAEKLAAEAQHDVEARWDYYEYLAARPIRSAGGDGK